MTIAIPNEEVLKETIENYGALPASNLQTVVGMILTSAHADGKEKVQIRISTSLFKSSYVQVPAMFARVLKGKSAYKHVRSSIDKGCIVVEASEDVIPGTFRSRVERDLKEDGICVMKREDIPVTYRLRPEALAKSLAATLCLKIKTQKKTKTIIWRVNKTI